MKFFTIRYEIEHSICFLNILSEKRSSSTYFERIGERFRFAWLHSRMLSGSAMSASNALQNMNSASVSSSSAALAVSSTSSYNSDRSSIQTGLDVEFANDAASGGFFNSDYKKYAFVYGSLNSI